MSTTLNSEILNCTADSFRLAKLGPWNPEIIEIHGYVIEHPLAGLGVFSEHHQAMVHPGGHGTTVRSYHVGGLKHCLHFQINYNIN